MPTFVSVHKCCTPYFQGMVLVSGQSFIYTSSLCWLCWPHSAGHKSLLSGYTLIILPLLRSSFSACSNILDKIPLYFIATVLLEGGIGVWGIAVFGQFFLQYFSNLNVDYSIAILSRPFYHFRGYQKLSSKSCKVLQAFSSFQSKKGCLFYFLFSK